MSVVPSILLIVAKNLMAALSHYMALQKTSQFCFRLQSVSSLMTYAAHCLHGSTFFANESCSIITSCVSLLYSSCLLMQSTLDMVLSPDTYGHCQEVLLL